jgi:hypothetical protein
METCSYWVLGGAAVLFGVYLLIRLLLKRRGKKKP